MDYPTQPSVEAWKLAANIDLVGAAFLFVLCISINIIQLRGDLPLSAALRGLKI